MMGVQHLTPCDEKRLKNLRSSPDAMKEGKKGLKNNREEKAKRIIEFEAEMIFISKEYFGCMCLGARYVKLLFRSLLEMSLDAALTGEDF